MEVLGIPSSKIDEEKKEKEFFSSSFFFFWFSARLQFTFVTQIKRDAAMVLPDRILGM